MSSFTAQHLTRLRRRLRVWFDANRRDLPWRRRRDAYAIWVSEVMLQQTQVTTVIPFYLRFLERFPTIAALAAAPEQDVLRQWEGLGYYRRARHLHRAARVIVADHSGAFPIDFAAASSLPGLGRYTVGAVLSQAFGQRLPVVDANVARVLCRLAAWTVPLEKRDTQAWLWHTATALLPRQNVGDFNQALMELGQTVCTPRQPACLLCPLRELCHGRAQGIAHALPRRTTKQEIVEVSEAAFLIQHDICLLLAQRKTDAPRWANMWEFPTTTLDNAPRTATNAKRLATRLTGLTTDKPVTFGTLRYGVTRFRMTLHGYAAHFVRGSLKSDHYQDLRWVNEADLPDYPLSIPQRRLIKLWQESRRPALR